eukprot:scaffold26821_cov86-Phaeocystis_antarctica.AAC.1
MAACSSARLGRAPSVGTARLAAIATRRNEGRSLRRCHTARVRRALGQTCHAFSHAQGQSVPAACRLVLVVSALLDRWPQAASRWLCDGPQAPEWLRHQ